jgi:hypothetical protein
MTLGWVYGITRLAFGINLPWKVEKRVVKCQIMTLESMSELTQNLPL